MWRGCLAFIFLFVLCVGGWAQTPAKLKAGDLVTIVVEGVENYSGDFTVSSDGSISGPGFGRLVVTGKTLAEAQLMLKKRLSRVVKRPEVSLTIKKQRAEHVFITGTKAQAAMLEHFPGLDLRQVVATSAFEGSADAMVVTLFRNGKKVLSQQLKKLLTEATVEGRTLLQPQDVVSIAEEETVRIWVSGFVSKPGEYRIPVGADPYQAIALAGGISAEFLDDQELRLSIRRGLESTEMPLRPSTSKFKLESGDVVILQAPPQVRVTVGGEVREPKQVVLREGELVSAAIAKAGGAGTFGTLRNVLLIRDGVTTQIDATQPYQQGKEASNILKNGDVLLVQRNERIVVVLGEVKEPGSKMMEDLRSYRLSDMLGEAKGFAPKGTAVRIFLGRKGPDGVVAIRNVRFDKYLKQGDLNENPIVEPGDIIMVGAQKESPTAIITQQILNAFYISNIFRR